jgi:hypothetical protein
MKWIFNDLVFYIVCLLIEFDGLALSASDGEEIFEIKN